MLTVSTPFTTLCTLHTVVSLAPSGGCGRLLSVRASPGASLSPAGWLIVLVLLWFWLCSLAGPSCVHSVTACAAMVVTSCGKCDGPIGNKAFLDCILCGEAFHSTCLEGWKDCGKASELSKLLKRPGLRWYCTKCEPTLATYISGGSINTKLGSLDTKIDNITKLICENVQQTKTYASAVADNPTVSEVRTILQRMETDTRNKTLENQKRERARNAILHRVTESRGIMESLGDACQALRFNVGCIMSSVRLGRRNPNAADSGKCRPVKLTFNSENSRSVFMTGYNKWADRQGSFCTPDLSPEERKREYELRKDRDILREEYKDTGRNFQIRHGAIYTRQSTSDPWRKCKIDDAQEGGRQYISDESIDVSHPGSPRRASSQAY